MPKTSVLIPLYRSSRFYDVIRDNIEALLDCDVEIVLSDRNGDETLFGRLAWRFGRHPKIRFLKASDDGDWIDNANALIAAAEGEYVRILPHDDSAGAEDLAALEAVLDAAPEAVLAFGRVLAIAPDRTRLPGRDQLNAAEERAGRDWTISDAAPLFWTGRFAGAFKGLVRTRTIRERDLAIRKTATGANSERCWLFGLALAGAFRVAPGSTLVKRYYAESTSRSWRRTPETIRDAARTMAGYARSQIADPDVRAYVEADLEENARRRAEAAAEGRPPPPYEPRRDDGEPPFRSRAAPVA